MGPGESSPEKTLRRDIRRWNRILGGGQLEGALEREQSSREGNGEQRHTKGKRPIKRIRSPDPRELEAGGVSAGVSRVGLRDAVDS